MARASRKTGLSVLGDMPWGTHVCHFYETTQDLLDTLVPYFQAGLEHNEFCLWVISAPLTAEDAMRALRQAVPDLDRHLAEHTIELLPYDEWYLQDGVVDLRRAIAGWKAKLDQALARGYAGMRVTGNTAWLPKQSWQGFCDYEQELNEAIADLRMIALCAYPLAASGAAEILDVAHTHQFALARRNGDWEMVELPELKRTKAEITRQNEALEQRVVERTRELAMANEALRRELTERRLAEEALRASQQQYESLVQSIDGVVWEVDARTFRFIFVSKQAERILGYSLEQWLGEPNFWATHLHPDDRDWAVGFCVDATERKVNHQFEYRMIAADGRVVWLRDIVTVHVMADQSVRLRGVMVDITERKQVEEEIRRHTARMEALAEISQALAEVGLDVQAVLETIVRHTADVIGDACIIRLLSSDEQWLKVVAFHHPNPEAKALMESLYTATPAAASNDWLAPVLRNGQPLLIPIVPQEQIRRIAQPEYLPYVEQVGIHSLLIVPLRVQGQVIGIVCLLRDHPGQPYTLDDQALLLGLADCTALTLQNAQLFEQVQGAHERLQALSRRLLEAQEAERRHIARELHDEIGQQLTGLGLLLTLSQHLSPGLVEAQLADAQSLVHDLMDQVRNLALDLRPAMLDDFGLVPALAWLFERYTTQTHVAVRFEYPGLEQQRFAPDVETAAYRIVQEALTNVARYAGVSEVTVRLWMDSATLSVVVVDQGCGFDPQAVRTSASTGLAGMHERTALLGGKLTIESAIGAGTLLTATLPRASGGVSKEQGHDA
jgi:PAS domain S-box-containing protein